MNYLKYLLTLVYFSGFQFNLLQQINFYDALILELGKELDEIPKEPYAVILVSELNCNTCFDFITELTTMPVYGFIIAKHPDDFQSRLGKFNPKIQWFIFNDKEIEDAFITKFNTHKSPSYFIISNSQINVNYTH
ncbi:hypothetical protein [Marivirga sp.]|uniref:hypothetical protein n=1 Tax=Marivirga sp. TaxID=2018662 RepID=UPI002D80C06F|nr:hypothetical protein [Marivirga sp.]HET8858329.1 hypothetical protein [Marivirga sp.]